MSIFYGNSVKNNHLVLATIKSHNEEGSKMKKISFIIPTYNGESYLSRCIKSILHQIDFNIEDIEILLIDDGSKDNSFDVAQRFADKYPSIVRSLQHENVGVARTRNKGIDLAAGEYISFIDQDDYIDPDFCSVLYPATQNGEFDVVFSGMKRPDEHGHIVSKDVYKDTVFARLMCMSVWAKLHKTDFLRQNNILLFENKQGEDIAFTFEEFQKTDKIRGLEYCGYNWFYNHESVSNTSQRKLTEDNVTSITTLQNRLFELDTKNNKLTTFFITMLSAYYIFFSGKGSTYQQFVDGKQTIMNNLRKHRPNFLRNGYLLIAPSGILPIFSIGVKSFMLIHLLGLTKPFAKVFSSNVK